MLLFDLEDYIPLLPKCPDTGEWADIASTARVTRDAFLKALNEWYKASIVCLDKEDPCHDAIVKQWNTMMEFYEGTYLPASDSFFLSLTTDNMIFTDEICNKYRKVSIEWRCHIKKIMRLVDGDFTGKPIQTYTKSLYE